MSAVETLVDKFIPEPLTETLDLLYRARILVMVSFTAAAVLIPFCLSRYWLYGFHAYVIILAAIVLVCVTTPLHLYATKSVRLAGCYQVTLGTIGFAILCLYDGGIYSPTIMALPILPLFGIFFIGFKLGNMILALNALIFVLLAAFPDSSWIQPSVISDEMLIYYWAASGISACLVLVSMAYFFFQWQLLVRDELLAANQAKNEFLSGMSHEIRTPLNSIMGFADVLQKGYSGELNDQQREHLGHILHSSEHLSSLVDDLLDLTNIEENRIELIKESFDVTSVLDDCVASIRRPSVAPIQLYCDHAPPSLFADKTRFKQIVLNLLGNAVKFTPPDGSVKIIASQSETQFRVSIEDTGPGVPAEHQDKIFDKFYQANAALGGKSKGSGLGLFISSRLAEMHGGSIELDFDYHNGCCFVLSLPMQVEQ